MSLPSTVSARIPATSANLGPGYDCLGLALALYNVVTVSRIDGPPGPTPHHSMVDDMAARFFSAHEVHAAPFAFEWSISGQVPISRGLGSSVTLRLGILEGLNALSGAALNRQTLFRLCSEAEKHPDNAGPAVFGGFFAGSGNEHHFNFPIGRELRFVLLIPDFEVLTASARAVLPYAIPHDEAARNAANAACLTAAFATGRYGALPGLFEDHLHQPYRRHLVPGMAEIIAAGVQAGAYGGYLSGSGSTLCCVASEESARLVAEAMKKAHPRTCEHAEVLVVAADHEGSHLM